MTLDEAIKEFMECAKADRKEQNYWAAERDETSPFSSAECVQLAEDCETRAEYNEQLAEWLTELKEAKRLLKAAVEDMNSNNICCDINAVKHCISCDTFHWRYTDEAEKLLKEE